MMPKYNAAKQRDMFNRTVRVCRERKGIRTDSELAARIGMSAQVMSQRISGRSSWKISELWRLIRVLEPTPDELALMMRA